MKLNREELAATLAVDLRTDGDLRAARLRVVPRGGGAVVTLGRDGSMGSDGRSIWRIDSPRVKAVSAVGSGDAYAAGMADGLSRGLSLAEACALGTACGAANALTALAGHVTHNDVQRLLSHVAITPVE